MSKFDELDKASKKATGARKAAEARGNGRVSCLHFADDLAKGLVGYFGCASEQTQLMNLRTQKRTNYMVEALTCDEAGWWEFYFRLVRGPAVPESSETIAGFHLMFKEEGDAFTVRLGQSDKLYVVHPRNEKEHIALYDHIFSNGLRCCEETDKCPRGPDKTLLSARFAGYPRCPRCNGNGIEISNLLQDCRICDGLGHIIPANER